MKQKTYNEEQYFKLIYGKKPTQNELKQMLDNFSYYGYTIPKIYVKEKKNDYRRLVSNSKTKYTITHK